MAEAGCLKDGNFQNLEVAGILSHRGFNTIAATCTLTPGSSGVTHIVGALDAGLAADTVITLPSAADGLNYEFIYVGGAADAQDIQINTGSDTNFFIGGIVQHDPDNGGDDTTVYHPDLNSNSKINLLTPDAGTHVRVFCDGTNWFLSGTLVSSTVAGVVWEDQS